jgi:hypothetical protein
MASATFASDEVFYYSQYHCRTWNRVGAGGRKEIGERLTADRYYRHENNESGQPAHINTLSLQIELLL